MCFTLKLAIYKPINGSHIFQPVKIDVVPCIHDIRFWPDDANKNVSERLKSEGCLLVFDQPQKIYPWIPVSISYARVSFARAESSVIRNGSAAVKAVFMVVKCFFSTWIQDATMKGSLDQCTSQVLKTAVLHCMASAARDKTKRSSLWTTNFQTITDLELKQLTRKLFTVLSSFINKTTPLPTSPLVILFVHGSKNAS